MPNSEDHRKVLERKRFEDLGQGEHVALAVYSLEDVLAEFIDSVLQVEVEVEDEEDEEDDG